MAKSWIVQTLGAYPIQGYKIKDVTQMSARLV
jgi:hypothetical protein